MKRYAIAIGVAWALFLLLVLACNDAPAPIIVEPMAVGKVGKLQVTVSISGSAGSATGSTSFGPIGPAWIDAIYLDYHAGIDAGTDITLSYASPAWGAILVRSNSATDGLFYPRQLPHDATASQYGDDGLVPWFVDGTLNIGITGSTSATVGLTATLYYVRP